jgi:hypothetical protein
VSRVAQKKSEKQCRCTAFLPCVLQFKRIITTVFVTLTLAFQYLERRECEYDLKISIDFYKVLIIV